MKEISQFYWKDLSYTFVLLFRASENKNVFNVLLLIFSLRNNKRDLITRILSRKCHGTSKGFELTNAAGCAACCLGPNWRNREGYIRCPTTVHFDNQIFKRIEVFVRVCVRKQKKKKQNIRNKNREIVSLFISTRKMIGKSLRSTRYERWSACNIAKRRPAWLPSYTYSIVHLHRKMQT